MIIGRVRMMGISEQLVNLNNPVVNIEEPDEYIGF
jgi:hypothetical protein